ncbi:GDP-mannose 4,6-dehydratase [bacterium]|nr:GDP-mannose 4,6-dehydratase [bacterium]
MLLITGTSGFIGFHLAKKLLDEGKEIVGYDVVNDYYDVSLKNARLEILKNYPNFIFYKNDLCDFPSLEKVFKNHKITKVCNLAAQAGVRYSLTNPFAYQKSNLEGFLNILELSKRNQVENFVYASSSSVYGSNKKSPFSVFDRVDNPISLYAASKKANELMAHTYSHLFKMPTTGLRFFTVYGPWGRPDMALFIFAKAIMEGKPIDIFNYGKMKRDFTFVTDIVAGIEASIERNHPCEVFNLGNNNPVELLYFVELIEKELGKTTTKNLLPIQPGDVPETSADIDYSTEKLGYYPKVSVEEGIKKFIEWYKEHPNFG